MVQYILWSKTSPLSTYTLHRQGGRPTQHLLLNTFKRLSKVQKRICNNSVANGRSKDLAIEQLFVANQNGKESYENGCIFHFHLHVCTQQAWMFDLEIQYLAPLFWKEQLFAAIKLLFIILPSCIVIWRSENLFQRDHQEKNWRLFPPTSISPHKKASHTTKSSPQHLDNQTFQMVLLNLINV